MKSIYIKLGTSGIQGVVLNIVISHVKHAFIALFRAYLKALSFLFSMDDYLCISVNRHEFTTSACFKMLRNIGSGSPFRRKFTNVKGCIFNRKSDVKFNNCRKYSLFKHILEQKPLWKC